LIAIIINPIAGGASPARARLRAELAARALEQAGEDGEIFVSERKGHARELAASAVARGARLVVAWGGDGTVNEVASSLVFGATPLAIVPAGSGNGLARSLGISRKADRALRDAFGAPPRTIDACELAGRLFFSVAGIGFDAHVAACFDRHPAGRRGFGTYVRISLRELLRYQPGRYQIGEAPPCLALVVVFANAGQYGNGVTIAPEARVDDGLIDLVVFEERSRAATFVAMPKLFTGGVTRVRGISIRQVACAVIQSDRPIPFHVDGEPALGGMRVEARVHAGALQVCVGR
jgi:YegS/Rv2252/BmrU family lipid kinase